MTALALPTARQWHAALAACLDCLCPLLLLPLVLLSDLIAAAPALARRLARPALIGATALLALAACVLLVCYAWLYLLAALGGALLAGLCLALLLGAVRLARLCVRHAPPAARAACRWWDQNGEDATAGAFACLLAVALTAAVCVPAIYAAALAIDLILAHPLTLVLAAGAACVVAVAVQVAIDRRHRATHWQAPAACEADTDAVQAPATPIAVAPPVTLCTPCEVAFSVTTADVAPVAAPAVPVLACGLTAQQLADVGRALDAALDRIPGALRLTPLPGRLSPARREALRRQFGRCQKRKAARCN